jgi:hypothetical protein
VVVDVDSVDRIGVEVGARHERVHVEDQHGLAGALLAALKWFDIRTPS